MASLVRALTVGTTSRALIFEANLDQMAPANKPVRQALGLRELTIRRPNFVSVEAQLLYEDINHLATKRLPVNSRDALHQAWHAGTFKKDIEGILAKYSNIWSECQPNRDIALNPDSHLYVAGEVEYYTTDLFPELRKHHELYVCVSLLKGGWD